MNSSPIYTAVTKHWPKIATGCVVVVGALEFVVGGLSSDSGLEWYFLAWGSMTGGLWFLFDIAEKTSPDQLKEKVAAKVLNNDLQSEINALPDIFAAFFDKVFGERHFTFLCIRRSIMASIISSWIIASLLYSMDFLVVPEEGIFLFGAYALVVNLIPDYLSLLQTRLMIGWVKKHGYLLLVLVIDVLATAFIFLAFTLGASLALVNFAMSDFVSTEVLASGFELQTQRDAFRAGFIGSVLDDILFMSGNQNGGLGILFLTTFFTSVWLWLYLVAIYTSNALCRLSSGVGTLLSVIDVETQPFRSLGFVSVLLVSGLFLLGLPFVIW